MIINDLSGSDEEFWNDYEKVPVIQAPPPGASRENEGKAQAGFSNNRNSTSPAKASLLSSITWAREYFEDKITRIREAKGPEIERKTIKAKNKVKKFYAEKLEFMRVKYITDFNLLMNEFNSLKQEMQMKDEFINQLVEILADSNLVATETMIKSMKNKKVSHRLNENLEIVALVEEVQNLRNQVFSLKDLCDIYQKDTDTAKKAHQDVVKVYLDYKENTEKTVKILQDDLNLKEITLQNFQKGKNSE
jgi:hypothetical protein